MLDKTSLLPKIIAHEGTIPHMYLDTAGLVTVGVGQMLPNVASAQQLPFVFRDSLVPASAEDIAKDYAAVSAAEVGLKAIAYQGVTRLILVESTIENLLLARIDEFMQQLSQAFPNYLSFPKSAQEGILDMAFNLGVQGLINKFHQFCAAVREENWQTCAVECHRRAISGARNDYTRALFEAAASPCLSNDNEYLP